MNVLKSYKYQNMDCKNSVLIYYLVIVCILAISFLLASVDKTGNMNSFLDANVTIFLFVLALCSFKESFKMMIQNGISRKSIFLGKLLTMVTVAGMMAIIEKILLLLTKWLTVWIKNWTVNSFFETLYSERLQSHSSFQNHMELFFLDFFCFLAVLAMGYFITLLYYRLSKLGKIVLSITAPAFILLVIPIINTVLEGKISYFSAKTMDITLGLSSQNPYMAMITCFLLCVVCSGFSWLLLQKAVIKE